MEGYFSLQTKDKKIFKVSKKAAVLSDLLKGMKDIPDTYDIPLNSSLIINPSQDTTESIKSTNLNLLNTSIITYNSFTVNPLGYTTDSLRSSTYLNSIINDLDTYIAMQIEAQVKLQKTTTSE